MPVLVEPAVSDVVVCDLLRAAESWDRAIKSDNQPSAPAELKRSEQVAQALVVALLVAIPALFCVHTGCVSDPDVWWHLRSAEWITQHHRFPHTDPFSSFGAGKPWAAYSWLFEVLVLQLFNRLGLAGIVLYTSGILLAITAALYHLARRLCSDFTVVVLLVFVASLSLGRLYTPRPWHFTILFFILELDILMHARRTGRTRELAWLPLIFGLWANLHIQFVDGLLVIALAGSEAVVARWWSAARTRLRIFPVAVTFVACLLATLVNPYGWGIYKVAHDLAAQPGVLDHVNELQAIPFRILTDYCVLLLAIAAVVALARYRRLRLFETALLSMAFLLAFRSQRDVWIMAAVATAVIASSLTKLESPPDFEIEPRRRGFAPALLLIPVVACLLLFAGFRVMDVNNRRLGLQLALDLPVDAAKAIKSAGYTGPLFNDYGWGGYLMWSLREPVSIDGRAALHGDQRMDRFSSTWDGAPDWISDRELAAAGVVIGPVKAPLIQLLRLDPRFKLVYEDKVAAVFIPNWI